MARQPRIAGLPRLSRLSRVGADRTHTDWFWRPGAWVGALPPGDWTAVADGTALGPGIKVFHDGTTAAVSLWQLPGEAADHALAVEVGAFEGAFLSLAIDLPAEGRAGRDHVVDLRGAISMPDDGEVFARLNICHGPNTETVLRALSPEKEGQVAAEFDLGSLPIRASKVGHLWLDLIFSRPREVVITIHDLTLARRLRAAI